MAVSFTAEAANSAPTDLPDITGTPQLEQTLTASTSGIADANGLTKVSLTAPSPYIGAQHEMLRGKRGTKITNQLNHTERRYSEMQESFSQGELMRTVLAHEVILDYIAANEIEVLVAVRRQLGVARKWSTPLPLEVIEMADGILRELVSNASRISRG